MLSKLSDLMLEEPKKLQKPGLALCRSVLIILFANWLYKFFEGDYNLIDIDSFSQWVEFLLSGRLLLCCLFFFLSYLILFEFVEGIVYVVFNIMFSPGPVETIDKDAIKAVEWTLRKFNVIRELRADNNESCRLKILEFVNCMNCCN